MVMVAGLFHEGKIIAFGFRVVMKKDGADVIGVFYGSDGGKGKENQIPPCLEVIADDRIVLPGIITGGRYPDLLRSRLLR